MSNLCMLKKNKKMKDEAETPFLAQVFNGLVMLVLIFLLLVFTAFVISYLLIGFQIVDKNGWFAKKFLNFHFTVKHDASIPDARVLEEP